MEREPRTTIAVRPAGALAERPRLFAALEAAFPVTFTAPGPGCAGEIVLDDDLAAHGEPGALPRFVAAAGTAAAGPREAVTLGAAAPVDARVRGVVLHDRLVGPPPEGEPLATAESGPVWTRGTGAVPLHRVRCVLPELAPDQVLYALLSQRAIAAVALIHFLRERCAPAGWRPPPVRAAFVFDDPNLRWRSYGFIDYGRLLAHADAHGYHVAMAMIPLDATRPHGPTRGMFADRPDRLSLVFHGNDHVKHELLAPGDAHTALGMAAQAVRRIDRFQRRSGLRVDRVMMPPHGLCSEPMARALGAVGFDALCAIHPLPWTEQPPASPPLAAWRPAQFVGGCAVIPRIPLFSTVADIALRGFLDHPVVVYGHHEDIAEGLEPLAEAAARVNRLGAVEWTSVGAIALGNAAVRASGDGLVVRPYARRVRVDAPAGASIAVEPPLPTSDALELDGWSLDGGPVVPFGAAAAVARGGPHELRLHGPADVDAARVSAPAWRPWPKLRRAGTEMRDRALPLRTR